MVVGDSAGGNLALAMVFKLLIRGLRLPDGLYRKKRMIQVTSKSAVLLLLL